MSQPTPYDPQTNFADETADGVSGRSTSRPGALDAEFANIATTTDQIIANLELIQRDDGELRDSVVTLASLSSAVVSLIGTQGFNPRGGWLTATAYAVGDMVEQGSPKVPYVCLTAHTSGTFATDYAAGKWMLLGSAASSNFLTVANNLSDLTNAGTARTNLGFNAAANGIRLGLNGGVPTNQLLRILQDSTNVADRGIQSAMAIQRTVGYDEGLSNPKALRVYTNKSVNSSQAEWALSAEIDTYSTTSSGGDVAISATANKYAANGGFMAGHFNAIDNVSYDNSTTVTAIVGIEAHAYGMGQDHPTSNNNLGLRITHDVVGRTPTQGTPAWASWQANTAYSQYDIKKPTATSLSAGFDGFYYECTTAGTSHATTEPTWPTTIGATVADGTCVWTARRGGEAGCGIRVRSETGSPYGHFRIGVAIQDDLSGANANTMEAALQIRTGGAYGIRMPATSGRVHTSDISLEQDSTYGLSAMGTYGTAAVRVADNQYIGLRSSVAAKFRFNTATGMVEWYAAGTKRMELELDATPRILMNAVQVLKERETGWTAGTGTPVKGAFAAYAGATVSAGYVQGEAQATDDAVKAASQRLLAVEQALINHGLIGA